MKTICCFVLVFASLCVAAEPPKFSVSRSFKRPLMEVRAAVLTYCDEAKTNHHAWATLHAKDEPGRFTQIWMDCGDAPPGALTGEFIVTSEPSGTTRLEVRTGATLAQDTKAEEARRRRTTNTLAGIVAVLERKP